MKQLLLTLTILVLSTSILFANTGASFLKIDISARATSMGGAFVGVCNDASAIHFNPAGLTLLSNKQIIAQHTDWIVDIKHDFIAFAMPIKTIQDRSSKTTYPGLEVAPDRNLAVKGEALHAIGASIIYLSQGDIEGRDENRQKTGSFSASDMAVTLSYAKSLNTTIKLGANTKFIQQKIANESAIGIAFDLGILFNTPIENTNLGFSVLNFGPQMRFISEGYDLPLTIAAGIGYNILGSLILAFDVKHSIYDGETDISLGTEYLPLSTLSLRLGYIRPQTLELSSNDNSLLSYFSGGIGLKISNFTTDYAFVPYGDLGSTHRISFSLKY